MARLCMQMHSGMSTNVAIANLSKESSNNEGKNNVERVELVTEKKKKKKKMKSSSRVLILGGTGRVGSSTAIALSKFCPQLRIVIAGRNRDKGAEMVSKIGNNSQFSLVDFNDTKSLEEALKDVDLVVHTAGPFQHADKCTVLEAAIQNKTAYLDVCDDTSYAWRAKSYMKKAVDANIPAITTGGICPGVSNVMAAELVRAAKSESKGEPQRLRFYYYYIAGSGGSRTILSREKIKPKPYSGMLNIEFGQGIGKQDVYLLNLPEVRSVHEVLGVPTVSARFGTAPFFWNWGMENITNLLPPETLRDRSKVEEVVNLLYPLVRAFDGLAGEKVSMRVDLECSNGHNSTGIFSHERLSESVGNSTAAFVQAILEGSTQPGVWFPEEPQGIAIEARETFLNRASQGTFNFIMNKASWMEKGSKDIGFGVYV